MPILHMQTEAVRAAGQQINQTSESLRQQAQQLRGRAQQLANEWQGPSASMFEQEMQTLLQRAQQSAEAGGALNQKVQKEVDEWERVAADLGGSTFGSGNLLGVNDQNEVGNFTKPKFDDIETKGLDIDYREIDGRPFAKGIGDGQAIDPNDVSQGRLGNCYFMASIAAIAQQNPDLIQNMIKDNGDGTYTVTLYRKKHFWEIWKPDFVKTEIVVDNQFPTVNGQPVFAAFGDNQGGTPEIWPMILEKAYAQSEGSYGDIEGGWTHEALQMLTGQESETFVPSSLSIDQLVQYAENGYAVGLESHFEGNSNHNLYVDDKLAYGHSYYLTNVDKNAQTVTLRNPWGWTTGETTITFQEFQEVFQKVSVNPL